MNTVRKWVKKILAGERVGSSGGSGPIFPGFRSLEQQPAPEWLPRFRDETGALLGVLEHERGSSRNAIVVTEQGLAVERAGGWTYLPYVAIDGWGGLSKVPPAKTLLVKHGGAEVPLLFSEPGEAFAFVQFLSGVKRVRP